MSNHFFKNNGPVKISKIQELLSTKQDQLNSDQDVFDIKDLFSSKKNDITFFHSKKYKDLAKNTKASFCITTESLKEDLPKSCKPILVDNFAKPVMCLLLDVIQWFMENGIDYEPESIYSDVRVSNT